MSAGFSMADGVDGVIALTVLEGLALVACQRLTGKGVAPRDFAVNMASGLCLMLALRGALRGGGDTPIALALLAAGAAHGTDLLLRWRRQAPQSNTNRSIPT